MPMKYFHNYARVTGVLPLSYFINQTTLYKHSLAALFVSLTWGIFDTGTVLAQPEPTPSDNPPLPTTLVGNVFSYTTQIGDTLEKISARLGAGSKAIARDNQIERSAPLLPGQDLWINNYHIVPETMEEGILINIPQRMLYLFRNNQLVTSFPVGLGLPDKEWRTPSGDYTVAEMALNKTWIVPKSIQQEMRREGKVVKKRVPPGPKNPLGKYWIGLSLWGYGIHSTIAPASIYDFRSHGCIRVHPDDIASIFDQVSINTRVRLIYQPVLLAKLPDGRIFLEIQKDVYNKAANPGNTVRLMTQASNLNELIDWSLVEEVLLNQDGLARDISAHTTNGNTP